MRKLDPEYSEQLAAKIARQIDPSIGQPWADALEQTQPFIWIPMKPAPAGIFDLRDYQDSYVVEKIEAAAFTRAINDAAEMWKTFLAGENDAEAILLASALDFRPLGDLIMMWVFANLTLAVSAAELSEGIKPPVVTAYRITWLFRAAGIKGAIDGNKTNQSIIRKPNEIEAQRYIIPGQYQRRGS